LAEDWPTVTGSRGAIVDGVGTVDTAGDARRSSAGRERPPVVEDWAGGACLGKLEGSKKQGGRRVVEREEGVRAGQEMAGESKWRSESSSEGGPVGRRGAGDRAPARACSSRTPDLGARPKSDQPLPPARPPSWLNQPLGHLQHLDHPL
jgi:hypothetical protein